MKQVREHCLRDKFDAINKDFDKWSVTIDTKNKKVNEHKTKRGIPCELDCRKLFLYTLCRPLPMKFINSDLDENDKKTNINENQSIEEPVQKSITASNLEFSLSLAPPRLHKILEKSESEEDSSSVF
jgi:hypothetical protein